MSTTASSQKLWSPKWITILITACLYSVTQAAVFMYAALIVELLSLVPIVTRFNDEKIIANCIDFLIVSVIMPDNYCILIAICYFAIKIGHGRFELRTLLYFLFLAIYCALNVILRRVPINNIFVSCIYIVPFFLIYGSCSLFRKRSPDCGNYILLGLKRMTLIEIVSVLLYAISHVSIVASYGDMDWVSGTMGSYQANTLMCVCSFTLLIFLEAIKRGDRTCVPWCVGAGILMVSTSSVSYLAVFALAFTTMALSSWNIHFPERAAIAILAIVAAVAFVSVSPAWISNEVVKMTDVGYARARLDKVKYYERTFIDLPSNEGSSFFYFGTGLGTYSSRSAMTCAGGYIDFYDKHFRSYSSFYRLKYLSDQDREKGLASMADSSIVSVQGELGFIGLVAITIFAVGVFLKAKDPFYRMAVLFFFGLFFVDNALEYAKFYSLFSLVVAYTADPSGRKTGLEERH